MDIKSILNTYNKIHVLGLSPKPERDSHRVAKYLTNNSFEVKGIRPATKKIDGIEVFESIADAGKIEILNVFRSPEHIPAIVDEAIKAEVKVLWLQLGVTHPEAEKKAQDAGIVVVSDRCIKVEHALV